jgi:hypothetical protein
VAFKRGRAAHPARLAAARCTSPCPQRAAHGLGNIEIAQTLFVVAKTFEKHLGHTCMKLGVNSRAALSAHFRE